MAHVKFLSDLRQEPESKWNNLSVEILTFLYKYESIWNVFSTFIAILSLEKYKSSYISKSRILQGIKANSFYTIWVPFFQKYH